VISICGTYGETNSYEISVSVTNFMRPRRMWKDNMRKTYLECVVWIHLAQNADGQIAGFCERDNKYVHSNSMTAVYVGVILN
jgi:hypothetical protein